MKMVSLDRVEISR